MALITLIIIVTVDQPLPLSKYNRSPSGLKSNSYSGPGNGAVDKALDS